MKKCIARGSVMAALMLFLSGCGSLPGNSQQESAGQSASEPPSEAVDYSTYQSYWMKQHDYKTMPICAFIAPPVKVGEYAENFVTEAQYRTLAESGINTAYGMTETLPLYASDVSNALSYCDKFGISYVASVSGIHTMKSASQVENAIYNPLLLSSPAALGGVIVRDEPSYSEFAGCKRAKELLEEFLPSDLLYHGNLFPDYATQEQLYNRGTGNPALPGEGYEYARYIDDYIEIFRPRVLSYDYYPMVGEDGYIREGYFGNMSVIRNRAAEAEIPFWVYIQTCSFNASVRVPDEGEIGWLVNTSLAYGAKGIQYFTYFLPNDDGEVFRGAMVDREGNKTPIYDYVQRVNGQIAAVDEILMCSFSEGVIVTGSTPCPVSEGDIATAYTERIEIEAGHVLTGCFDHRGNPVYYAVNNSIAEPDRAVFSLEGQKGYYIVDGEKREFENRVEILLEEGQGVLIVPEG